MSGYERSDTPERSERPEERDEQDEAERIWPADFSLDERQFAAELRELFPIEDEILPPLYVQTLLDDELRAPLPRDYTRRLIARVMRRLGLPRTLPSRHRLSAPNREALQTLVETVVDTVTEPIRRASAPALAALALLVALIMGSVYLATPSFAEGLRLLLGQTGAQQLTSYPTNITQPSKPHLRSGEPQNVSPLPYWLGPVFGGYAYLGMSQNDQQDWSNGPVLDLQYALTLPAEQGRPANATTHTSDTKKAASGSGMLDIREFQISTADSAVLIAVQNGAATMTSVNAKPAVYVNGMWTVSPGGRKTWQSGTRSMLIFERDGVIFWITGDQRDGLDAYALTQIAAGLTPTKLSALRPSPLAARLGGSDVDANLRAPLGANTDVLEVIGRGGSNSDASQFVTLNLPMPTLMS
jgi:hypothetical protein